MGTSDSSAVTTNTRRFPCRSAQPTDEARGEERHQAAGQVDERELFEREPDVRHHVGADEGDHGEGAEGEHCHQRERAQMVTTTDHLRQLGDGTPALGVAHVVAEARDMAGRED